MKNTLSKNIIILSTIIFCAFTTSNLFAQEGTYKIVKENNLTNVSDYITAMDKANFDSYRYVNNRRKLVFNTGLIIELLSVQELENSGIAVDASKAMVYDPKKLIQNPVYRLNNNGHIIAEFQTANKK